MTKTKILCSLGPSSENESTIKELLGAGVSGFRLSATHYDVDKLIKLVKLLAEIRSDSSTAFSIIVDLPGSKLRAKPVSNSESLELLEGETVFLVENEVSTNKKQIMLNEPSVLRLLGKDDTVSLMMERLS